jgi:hypothetical protein
VLEDAAFIAGSCPPGHEAKVTSFVSFRFVIQRPRTSVETQR